MGNDGFRAVVDVSDKGQPMAPLARLLAKNKMWAQEMNHKDSGFFAAQSQAQRPRYLWIGCSDSRVPASHILDLEPGQVFEHRNLANQVQASDDNCMSVIEYALEHLAIKDVIICGHRCCGGIAAVIDDVLAGRMGRWLTALQQDCCAYLSSDDQTPMNRQVMDDLLTELNVLRQVFTLNSLPVVQCLREAEQGLRIHGLLYDVSDGRLRELCSIDSNGWGEDGFDHIVEDHLAAHPYR